MSENTEWQKRQFPHFSDIESIECEGNFKIYRSPKKPGYCRVSWHGNMRFDKKRMSKVSPSLGATLDDDYRGKSAFDFMDDKLVAFGLSRVRKFLLPRPEIRLLGRTPNLRYGKKSDVWEQYFPDLVSFEVELKADATECIYNQIANSPAGQDMEISQWSFKWRNLPGGPNPRFIVYEKAEREEDFDLPVTESRLEKLCQELLGSSQLSLILLSLDISKMVVYVMATTQDGETVFLPLDPEKYYVST